MIDATFEPRFSVEALDELPGGPSAVHYIPGDRAGGQDGVLLRVQLDDGDAWIGLFAFGNGGTAVATRVTDMPDATKLCVVARGAGYIVDARDPNDVELVKATPVIDVRAIPEAGLVVFASHTDLVAYGERGLAWRTERLAWDGFTILSTDARTLRGEYWEIRSEAMQPFEVDLRTGDISSDLARAPVRDASAAVDITALVETLRRAPDCEVLPPSGLPEVAAPYRLPDDVRTFYALCGGVRLFPRAPYFISIVPPSKVTSSSLEILGQEFPEDRTDSWRIIAREGQSIISLDCRPEHLGRCYDSFWDRHGIAGSSTVIALSFTELLRRLVDTRGGYWYWLRDDFRGYGDAYD